MFKTRVLILCTCLVHYLFFSVHKQYTHVVWTVPLLSLNLLFTFIPKDGLSDTPFKLKWDLQNYCDFYTVILDTMEPDK